jgi:hypothetical protein
MVSMAAKQAGSQNEQVIGSSLAAATATPGVLDIGVSTTLSQALQWPVRHVCVPTRQMRSPSRSTQSG